MTKSSDFTKGKILPALVRFALPVLAALCLQAMYGAVDLLVVGRFGSAAGVSAVSTGSQLMQTVTMVVTGLAMGTTVLLSQMLGEGKQEEAGDVIGAAVVLFGAVALGVTALLLALVRPLCLLMRAPAEALEDTVAYAAICSGGMIFIVAYNLLGSVFRGIGDSKTPLFTVLIACAVNIAGDLFFVAVLHMGAAGAAAATVLAQGVSVALCLAAVRRRGLPFPVKRGSFSLRSPRLLPLVRRTVRLGAPIALQDLLVSISFLVILAIVNSLGVMPSAGVGVAEKLCAFIMLIPSACMQSLSAFVGQNVGARRQDRAVRAMVCGMAASFALGCAAAWLAFFHGTALAGIFTRDAQVAAAAADYLRAYAIDTLLVSFLFCFCGYFNGCGKTGFVMAQGIIGAFGVRIPVSWLMRARRPVSLFAIGLATPCSTVVQIALCAGYFAYLRRKDARLPAA